MELNTAVSKHLAPTSDNSSSIAFVSIGRQSLLKDSNKNMNQESMKWSCFSEQNDQEILINIVSTTYPNNIEFSNQIRLCMIDIKTNGAL